LKLAMHLVDNKPGRVSQHQKASWPQVSPGPGLR
jgi:hypothetical protein